MVPPEAAVVACIIHLRSLPWSMLAWLRVLILPVRTSKAHACMAAWHVHHGPCVPGVCVLHAQKHCPCDGRIFPAAPPPQDCARQAADRQRGSPSLLEGGNTGRSGTMGNHR